MFWFGLFVGVVAGLFWAGASYASKTSDDSGELDILKAKLEIKDREIQQLREAVNELIRNGRDIE